MRRFVISADIGRRLLVILALVVCLPAQARPNAAIASAHPLATVAGHEVLARGGNAFDAAVAVAAALAVVEPYGSGLGGGGFWLLHRADGRDTVLDARERAPAAATPRMYLGADGKPDPRASLYGARAAAIPGTPAALAHLAARYGRLPLADSLAPAIRYAREGYTVDRRYLDIAALRASEMDASAAALFLDNGRPPGPGFRLRQPALAATLQTLARYGFAGFYRGLVAREMVRAVEGGGGIWSERDLADYQLLERSPISFSYAGVRIVTVPPPSAGGVGLAQALRMLERLPYAAADAATRAHLVAEVLRRTYRDRARFLGDPAFVSIPLTQLTSPDYLAQLAGSIDLQRATPSTALPEPAAAPDKQTTHFSVVDAQGNRVAATLTINTWFGSGFVAGRTGVLLNNEMDDFAVDPGSANVYGLVGGAANAIAPGKRPLSSMTPTFVEDRRGVLVLGTPGGSRIVSMLLLAVLDYAGGETDPLRIVAAPRMHHQYLPDRVEVEPEFPKPLAEALLARGHEVKRLDAPWGNMQAIFVDRHGEARAASDPRPLPREFVPAEKAVGQD